MGEHASNTRQRPRSHPRQHHASGAEEMGAAILAAAADGVVAIDDRGIIRFGNDAAARLLGLPPGDAAGRPFGHEIVPGQADEIRASGPGGERVLDVRTTTTSVAGERLRVAVLRDVTQGRHSRHALEAALDQQSAALAMAGHELHSPLAAIGVLAHVLADQQVSMEAPERAKLAERIVGLSGRLQMLMRRLLTSVQLKSDDPCSVPGPEASSPPAGPEGSSRVLEVVTDQLALSGTAPGKVAVRCSPALAVAVDRAELTMMLANYVDNALAYARPPIEISAQDRSSWTEIEVRDHGPGIAASFEPLLFERFARAPEAERQAAGLGLGLWIVRTLARAAGGDAWYEPAEDGGSRFLLRLPRGGRQP